MATDDTKENKVLFRWKNEQKKREYSKMNKRMVNQKKPDK